MISKSKEISSLSELKYFFSRNFLNQFNFVKIKKYGINQINALVYIIYFIIIFSSIALSKNKSINFLSVISYNSDEISFNISVKKMENIKFLIQIILIKFLQYLLII